MSRCAFRLSCLFPAAQSFCRLGLRDVCAVEVNPVLGVAGLLEEPLVLEPASITHLTNLYLLLCSGLLLKVLCGDFWGKSRIRRFQGRVPM